MGPVYFRRRWETQVELGLLPCRSWDIDREVFPSRVELILLIAVPVEEVAVTGKEKRVAARVRAPIR